MMEQSVEKALEFSHGLTTEEVAMFEKIRMMEDVHNALGAQLAEYRDGIMRLRNDFVARLGNKYQFDQPERIAYDPVQQKIVSVFHPNLKAHKIIGRSNALDAVASSLIVNAIKEMTTVFEAIVKRTK